MTNRQLMATSPAATTAAPEPQPTSVLRVRHIVTGDVGLLVGWSRRRAWAHVRWDPAASTWSSSEQPPGLTVNGVSTVAPGLLIRVATGRRVGR